MSYLSCQEEGIWEIGDNYSSSTSRGILSGGPWADILSDLSLIAENFLSHKEKYCWFHISA